VRFDRLRHLVLSGLLAATPAGARAFTSAPSAPVSARVLILPLRTLLACARAPFARRSRECATTLVEAGGWRTVVFPVHEAAHAVYLEVAGRAQFDSAEILDGDGKTRALDLHGVTRDDGMFELVSLPAARAIAEVRLTARSASPRARIALCVARDDLDPTRSR